MAIQDSINSAIGSAARLGSIGSYLKDENKKAIAEKEQAVAAQKAVEIKERKEDLAAANAYLSFGTQEQNAIDSSNALNKQEESLNEDIKLAKDAESAAGKNLSNVAAIAEDMKTNPNEDITQNPMYKAANEKLTQAQKERKAFETSMSELNLKQANIKNQQKLLKAKREALYNLYGNRIDRLIGGKK